GGLFELARAGGVRLDVERDAIPVLPGVLETCEFFDVDPWAAISEGTLLCTVDPESVDAVLAALDDEGIPAAEVGSVREGEGVFVDGERIEHPGVDPFWATFEENVAKQRDAEDGGPTDEEGREEDAE
ncbi:AIR synthase-related protein, partial [Halobium palmae]